ncbi:MAG: hypothetical protein WC375_00360 [Methanomassiliicoccales archaeon]|jgi:hypothetical protein
MEMTLNNLMMILVNVGCYPCCSYRGGGIYRAHINAMGNRWDEGKSPYIAMKKAYEAWRHDGYPMDGLALDSPGASPKMPVDFIKILNDIDYRA